MAINKMFGYIGFIYMISNKNLCLLIWFLLFTINIPVLIKKQFLVLEHENQQKIKEKCNLFIRFFLLDLAEDFSDMTEDWWAITAGIDRLWSSGYQNLPPQHGRRRLKRGPAAHTEGQHLCWCRKGMSRSCQTPEEKKNVNGLKKSFLSY